MAVSIWYAVFDLGSVNAFSCHQEANFIEIEIFRGYFFIIDFFAVAENDHAFSQVADFIQLVADK